MKLKNYWTKTKFDTPLNFTRDAFTWKKFISQIFTISKSLSIDYIIKIICGFSKIRRNFLMGDD